MSGNGTGAADAFEALPDDMAEGGTQKVVYFFNPDPSDSNWSATKTCLDALRPQIQAQCEGATAPECFWLDQRSFWEGHPEYSSDGLHPSTAGSEASGDAIWSSMVENCVAQ